MSEVPARSPFADLPPTGPVKRKSNRRGTPHEVPLDERLWAEVDKSGDCWLWTGPRNWKGYGRIGVGNGKTVGVHRVSYQLAHPDQDITGLQIDHTCHGRDESCIGAQTCPHRRCVNPAHLEPVNNRTNTARSQNFMAERIRRLQGNRCGRGHEMTPENTYQRSSNHRECKTCGNLRQRRYYAQRRDQLKGGAA